MTRLPATVNELGRIRVALAAVLVEAPVAALDALEALPGVRRVDPIVDYSLALPEVVPYVGGRAQSEAVAEALRAEGHAVRRVSGSNRFATAVAVADQLAGLRPSDEVVVVEGADADPTRGFPDALSAAGLAASQGLPILPYHHRTVTRGDRRCG